MHKMRTDSPAISTANKIVLVYHGHAINAPFYKDATFRILVLLFFSSPVATFDDLSDLTPSTSSEYQIDFHPSLSTTESSCPFHQRTQLALP